jgi:hypothetical protein
MAKLPDLYVNAVTTFDGKALAKGQKQIGGFEKSVKNLAKTFGVTFGAAAMLSYGRNAVKAFAENEKSAKRLETVLKNIGLGFDTAAIEKNLGDISAKFGYEGEVLRESFQKLVTVTGDTAKAQDLLNLSLDVAAGSGQDLLTVNQDLAGAVVGNTKGLRKYNLGLTQTELKTLDFNKAVTLLTKTFAGAGTAELETYSGKMRVLREAADNAQEIIGGGLVDALSKLGDDDSVSNLAKSMQDVAEYTADVIRGVGVLAAKLKALPGAGALDVGMIPILGSYIKALAALGKVGPQPFTTPMTISGSTDAQVRTDKARAKAQADAARREKERLALLKKSERLEKNKLSLSKAASVFDTNRISIAAALQATYDRETRLRLEALMAIEDDNGELALKRITELGLLQKSTDFDKLAGITKIKEETLAALNTQLLAELKVINDSKMAETDKEAARQIAFGKYNEALTKAGELAAKESYSERVQIQLTEIARLASLSKTSNAATTLTKLRESEELNMIDRVAKAQKAADDARLKALQEYISLLNKVNTNVTSSANKATIEALTPKQAEALLAKEPSSVPTKLTPAQISGLRYAAQAQDAYEKSLSNISLTDQIAQASLTQGLNAGLSVAAAASGSRYAAQAAAQYNVTVNAGVVGSEETIVTAVQEAILTLNRRGDSLVVAGTL